MLCLIFYDAGKTDVSLEERLRLVMFAPISSRFYGMHRTLAAEINY
jgi:hypothetical protein